jgi:cytochrome c-type biogenesis protein
MWAIAGVCDPERVWSSHLHVASEGALMTGIGLLAAFAAGTISFLSPCVLPLVPGYVSYIAGQGAEADVEGPRARLTALGLGLCFVLGFSMVFILFGAGATTLGQWLLSYRYQLNILGGALVIAFGLLMLGLFRPGWLLRDLRFHLDLPGGRPLGAVVLGTAFAFGWTPCIGPMLGAILTLSAGTASLSKGVTLLAVYAAGLGLPFLASALFTEALSRRIRVVGRLGRYLHMIAGAVMVAMGGAMVTGQLASFSYWLLATFPVLGRIG